MLTVQRGVSLRPYTTFGIEAQANYFADIASETDLTTLFQLTEFNELPLLVLGGGSNLLLTQEFAGLVIRLTIGGIEVVREDDLHVYVQAGAGVIWHELVMYCVANNYAGMENLSLIPGTVGAAPMQNIGAYGVEIEQIFDHLEAVHVGTGEKRRFNHADCRFGYRESVFKHDLKGQYIITLVTFRLDKTPTFHTRYGAISETLTDMGITDDTMSIRAVSDAVIQIRRSKLPDPAEIGNAGSFFKNPEIPVAQFDQLKATYPTLPGYPTGTNLVKVPAGWLIEQAGWKGYRQGDAGVHAKQALVLVNYGRATGSDILALAQQVQASVLDKFGITINPEVNVL
ncbi:UDP-N-acetylmuramate dehydrogenase [Fibrella arboris]|uniref:UDP-N-acetylmuramate dehydrogenase n=1 Tax=Fibrella arboris TaxID=3242486 RepID=UPI003520E831